MNGAVGTNPSLARGKAPVDGPWLDGSHGHLANSAWYTHGKLTDPIEPSIGFALRDLGKRHGQNSANPMGWLRLAVEESGGTRPQACKATLTIVKNALHMVP